MKKIFLATSFSHVVDPETNEVLPAFKTHIEQIVRSLREDAGVTVFCAMEDEGWRITTENPPEIGVKKDIGEVDASDVLLALVRDQPSVGTQFEIGYMVAKGKQVILAMETGGKLAYFNQGLVSAGFVTLVTYDSPDSLAKQLAIAVNAPQSTGPAV